MKQNNSVAIGTFPKWFGKLLVWFLSRNKPKDVRFKLYGRGKGSGVGRYNYGSHPVRFCPKVAVYVYFVDGYRKQENTARDENWRLRNRVATLEKELSVISSTKGGD